ncbi:hypothetical protein HF313_22045 [Massilia atriviolacea]|uniref:Uncharacterized protein n=1 Tax=Massilia atriviolacea TaxID=2495579 RepID=A0A430HFG2_9BURK|nr:hypothetical protein [Massilia atriviolacea]RSZ56249.1 hypothetical protein EJB06_25480 [Massilia atriviolacea]
MNSQNILIKIIQNSQRRHFSSFLAHERNEPLRKLVLQPIFFPASGDILQRTISIMKDARLKKETFFAADYPSVDASALSAIRRLPDLPSLLCFFPTYHANGEYISSDLPVMEIQRAGAEQWYRSNPLAMDALSLFFCISPNFSCGMIMDVCAGDPLTSGSDDPIYDIYSWNFE